MALTLDTAHNYTPTFIGLGTQLGISAGISLYCLLQFEWNRHQESMQYLYSPRTKLSKNPSPPIPPGLFSWVKATIFLSDEFYLTRVGLDALMYIRFLRMAFQFLLFNSIIVGLILMPTNYFAGGFADGVEVLSINNIPVNKTQPLWAHMICTYIVSISWMYLSYKNYYHYMTLHRQHLLNKVETDSITARTVMVSRLPHDLRSEEKLQEFVDGLGLGPVETTRIVRHTGKLDRKIYRREKALLLLEKAHIQLAKNVCNTIKGRKLFGIGIWARLFGYKHGSSQDILEAGETKEHQRIQSLVEWLNPRKKKSDKSDNNQIQSSSDQDSNINRHYTTPSEDIMNQEDGYGRQFLIWDSLAHISKPVLDRFQPIRRIGVMKGEKLFSIDHFLKKFNYLDRRIAELRSIPTNAPTGPYKATGIGFVTFRDHISAQICAQSIISSTPHTCTTRMAPEPRDLLWENLIMRFRENMIRYIIVNACVWALTIFWLFPIFAFLTLTSIETLSQRISFLGAFLEATPAIRTLLQNVLPTVLVSFFMGILPWILMEISKQECFVSYSELEEAVLVRFYQFSFFNVFIVFLLGITFLQSIFDAINNPTNIIELLATSLPKGATFFINYVVFNICTHGFELVQVGSQIFLHIILTSRFIATTPRMLKRATNPWPFQFYFYYPSHILILVITITYSTINPLILIFALVYYAIALVVFKHQFAYCYVRRYEAGGKFYRRVFRYTTDGLIIFQLTALGVIWLRRAIAQGVLIVLLIIATGYFKYYCHKTFHSRTNYLALDTRSKQQTKEDLSTPKKNQSEGSIDTVELSKKDVDEKYQLKINATDNIKKDMSSQMIETNADNVLVKRIISDESHGSDSESSTKYNSSNNMHSKIIDERSSVNLIEKIEFEKSDDHGTQQTQQPKTVTVQTNIADENIGTSNRTTLKLSLVPPNLDPSVRELTSSPVSCPDLGITRTPLRSSRSNMYPLVMKYDPNRIAIQDESSQYQTYMHPNLVKDLNRKLWLPRDPLKTITIEDTVELTRALTSSEGGSGVVGFWGEASTYLNEAKVSMYGVLEFVPSPHQRDATGSTVGEVPGHHRRKTTSNGDPETNVDDCNGEEELCDDGIVSLGEFFSGELRSGELSSGEEY
ncbi:5542_t:CDS:2 [Cetraspora pellucida]|uniref:5542_t:CDS:1 n=1 Tax=Cetraspora pellucida TaxID=1433469 RepID=A0A9N9I6X8_9GLOM|nr:5542_t:CDS:2 [Cetraspora pellucida]